VSEVTPPARDRRGAPDGLRPARGLLLAAALSAVFWAALAALVWL
jgi:hypothetical protein